jgi:hypothetical protein
VQLADAGERHRLSGGRCIISMRDLFIQRLLLACPVQSSFFRAVSLAGKEEKRP